LFKKIFVSGTIVAFVICMITLIFADTICAVILGQEYSAAGACLRILTIGLFFAFPSNLLGYPALSPIGLEKHANIAIMVSAVVSTAIYTVLWMMDAVSILSVCIVMALRNIISFAYRGIVLYAHIHSINSRAMKGRTIKL
jgi:PST family polysaccharide transporter